jgi:hypothetical protein
MSSDWECGGGKGSWKKGTVGRKKRKRKEERKKLRGERKVEQESAKQIDI